MLRVGSWPGWCICSFRCCQWLSKLICPRHLVAALRTSRYHHRNFASCSINSSPPLISLITRHLGLQMSNALVSAQHGDRYRGCEAYDPLVARSLQTETFGDWLAKRRRIEREAVQLSRIRASREAGCETCATLLDAGDALSPGWVDSYHEVDPMIRPYRDFEDSDFRVQFLSLEGRPCIGINYVTNDPLAKFQTPTLSRPITSRLAVVSHSRSGEAFRRIAA
ncbi:hypothetical protein B0T16DRAFT_141149 [Cercophora newfieldiana]|uniref:Uncharacterized protein n=1 Tax=Cercophora newfieldiana TaxID=92897 RepID=A0AA39Y4E7_9PEZI|nr:hypothetical protein B0T16DRAFT_141149 [Cercophora newfieldiana]